MDAILAELGLEMSSLDLGGDKVRHTVGKDGRVIGEIKLEIAKSGNRSVKATCKQGHNDVLGPGRPECACWCIIRSDMEIVPLHCALLRWYGSARHGEEGRWDHINHGKAINAKYSTRQVPKQTGRRCDTSV